MTDTYTPPVGQEQVYEIERNVEWLVRSLNDKDRRLANATEAGAALAKEIRYFTEAHPDVLSEALLAACQTFMERHAGNFHV